MGGSRVQHIWFGGAQRLNNVTVRLPGDVIRSDGPWLICVCLLRTPVAALCLPSAHSPGHVLSRDRLGKGGTNAGAGAQASSRATVSPQQPASSLQNYIGKIWTLPQSVFLPLLSLPISETSTNVCTFRCSGVRKVGCYPSGRG